MRRATKYAKKYLDPRWQKKRLEVLDWYGWNCQMCGDGDSTLHVHHRYYRWGNDPWDYPNEALAVLCEKCHELESPCVAPAKKMLVEKVSEHLFSDDIVTLAVVLQSAFERHAPPALTVAALAWAEKSGHLHELEQAFIFFMASEQPKKNQ